MRAIEAHDANAKHDREKTRQLQPNDRLQRLADYDGNLLDAMDEVEANRLASTALEEWGHDTTARKEWTDQAKRSLDLANQKPSVKNTPFQNASNVNYPTLTVAAMQFNARSMPAILKGDEVLSTKVVGKDVLGFKKQRAARLATFCNDQIIYEMTEWEPGTDALLMALPIVGAGFRKMCWDHALDRPRADYASALKVYADPNAASLDQAPRVTQEFERYPYQIAQMIMGGYWKPWGYAPDTDDTQKPCPFIEQHRYLDLDGDGLPEPYILTVDQKESKPVRLDAAYDKRDLRIGEHGDVESVTRFLPWVDYRFLPDPEGGLYGSGFGKLLESLQAAIDTTINQIMDAGRLANSPGGFIGQGLNLRGGSYRIEPNVYKMVNASSDDIRRAIYTHDFKGPNPVQFQVLDLLLGAAKDITAVKDVLTGEAPSNQPATSTLALIEQGLTVFTAIYRRIYLGLRQEYQLLFRLNHRYLSPEKYKALLDSPLEMPQMVQQAMQSGQIPPNILAQVKAEVARGVGPEDFADADYDIRPISDPSAVTQMQQLAKANFLASRAQARPDLYNGLEVETRLLEAARIDGADKVLNQPQDPMATPQGQAAALDVELKKQEVRKTGAEADKTMIEGKALAFEAGATEGAATSDVGAMAPPSDNGMDDAPMGSNGGRPEAAMAG